MTNRRNVTQTVDPFADAETAAAVEAIVETPTAAPAVDQAALRKELTALIIAGETRTLTSKEMTRSAELYGILAKAAKAAARVVTAGESKAEIAAKAAAAAAEANAQLDKVRVALNTAIVSAIDAVKNEGNTVPKFTLTYSPETGLEIKTASVKVTASAGNGGTRTRPARDAMWCVTTSLKRGALEKFPFLADAAKSGTRYSALALVRALGMTDAAGNFVTPFYVPADSSGNGGRGTKNMGGMVYAIKAMIGTKAIVVAP